MPDTSHEHQISRSSSSQKVSTPVIKLLIGFIAGLCAAFLPRLTASLAVSGSETGIILIDTSYITLSLGFALLVGLTVMILEWRVPREPRATFMMAIGVPALITGSFNTSNGIDAAATQTKDNQALVQRIQDLANIKTMPASGGITPLSMNTNDSGDDQQSLAWLQWVGIQDAKAASTPLRIAGATQTGITINEPMFYIVLAQASSKDDALSKAQTMKAKIPGVVAVRSGTQYLILYSQKPMKRTDAVLLTVTLQQKYQLSPQLLSAK